MAKMNIPNIRICIQFKFNFTIQNFEVSSRMANIIVIEESLLQYVRVELNPQKHLIIYDCNTAWTLCQAHFVARLDPLKIY